MHVFGHVHPFFMDTSEYVNALLIQTHKTDKLLGVLSYSVSGCKKGRTGFTHRVELSRVVLRGGTKSLFASQN